MASAGPVSSQEDGYKYKGVGSVYTCKDDQGRTITADRPIAECATKPLRELRFDGTTKREIPPPLTREQIARRQQEEEQRRLADYSRKQQEARDKALLLAYPTVTAAETARQRAFDEIDEDIAIAQRRMVTLHRELLGAQQEAEFYKNRKLPGELQRKIQQTANSILSEDAFVNSRTEERRKIDQRFAEDIRRLREIVVESSPVLTSAPPPRR